MKQGIALIPALLLLGGLQPAWPQEPGTEEAAGREWPLCPASLGIPARPVVEDELEPGDIHILADQADLHEGGVSHLEGNVQVTRDSQQAVADTVDYDEPADRADLQGNVRYWDNDIYLEGDKARLEFDDGTGTMEEADYRILGNRGRGDAESLFMDVGTRTRGTRVNYTTCDPEVEGFDIESNFWRFSAASIDLDHDAERGSAKHVVLRIKDVPVFYSPYLSFPLSDRRKTGFLFPGLGSTSEHGFEIRTPWYWNIAPDMDATFTPRLLTDIGVMGMGEFRYLVERGGGQVNVEYLPSDNKFDDKDRHLVGFLHEQWFSRQARMYATYNRVSDRRYFEDFGSQLSTTSTRFLPSRLDFVYRGDRWRMLGRIHDFQTVDDSINPASRPYTKMPQIRLSARPLVGNRRINMTADGEFTYFDRNNELFVNEVNGFRMDLYPALSYPVRTRSGYFIPKIGVHYTQYELADEGTLFESSPSRILPVASVDTGLFLERKLEFTDTEFVQTLEPRLYYLYIPDDNQDDIPVFDTGIYNQSYYSMFREDRFTGLDRMGDANQVTLAVTSRLIDRSNGHEWGYVRLGQTFFLSDQDVVRTIVQPDGSLFSTGDTTEDFLSVVIADFGVNVFDAWRLRGELQFDPNDNITEKMVVRAQYAPGDGRVLNVGYRVRRSPSGRLRRTPTDIEQTDISFRWPLARQWSIVGRWNYAVPENRSLELFGGIEYEGCCWGVRAVARRFLSNLDGDFSTGIFLQIELKGLAGIGRNTVDFLDQRIPGYETAF